MPSRYRRLVLPAFMILALAVAPSLASAQAQDQSAPQVSTPAAHLLHGISFLPAPLPATDDPAQAAQPQVHHSGGHSQGFGIGAKIGPLFSSLSGDVSYSNRTGLIGGLWFGGNRGGVVGVMGELLYAKRNGGSGVDLHYLEIPILLRINIGQEGANGARAYILAGPVADVLLKGSQNGIDVKSNYSSLDVGVKFGIGFEVMRLLIEAQENIGLRNVLNSDNAGAFTKIHSRNFAIMVGVRFN